jgi:peptidoglycan/LPS O-acetylase OafA/YrhL
LFKIDLKMAPQPGELLTINLLRLFAASAVMLFHFGRFMRGPLSGVLAQVDGFTFAVDLFFVISGFIIAYLYEDGLGSLKDYGRFLRRRFARLAPLHWLTLSFFVMLALLAQFGLAHTDHAGAYDWRCFAPNFLGLHAFPDAMLPAGLSGCHTLSFNFVSWSVSAEWGMYLIAPLMLAAVRRNAAVVVLLSVATMVALTVLRPDMQVMRRLPWYEWRAQLGVVRALPEFAFGVGLYAFRGLAARMPAPRRVLGLLLAIFTVGCLSQAPMPLLMVLVFAIAVTGVACDMGPSMDGRLAKVAVFGRMSYSIYMIHPVVLTIMLSFVGQRWLHLDGVWANIWSLLAMGVTFVASYLSFRFVEDPARRFLSGAGRRSSNAVVVHNPEQSSSGPTAAPEALTP